MYSRLNATATVLLLLQGRYVAVSHTHVRFARGRGRLGKRILVLVYNSYRVINYTRAKAVCCVWDDLGARYSKVCLLRVLRSHEEADTSSMGGYMVKPLPPSHRSSLFLSFHCFAAAAAVLSLSRCCAVKWTLLGSFAWSLAPRQIAPVGPPWSYTRREALCLGGW